MNITLATARSPDSDRLLLAGDSSAAAAARARLSFADRLQLRFGLWLLLRGTRRLGAASDHTDHGRRVANVRSRTDREHTALRAHALESVRT